MTPTHFLPDIVAALIPKLPVPVVMNCGGYESVQTLRAVEGVVDVYLPDLKYLDGSLAARLSGAADYPQGPKRRSWRCTGRPALRSTMKTGR